MNFGTPMQCGSIQGGACLIGRGSAPIAKGVSDDSVYFGTLSRYNQNVVELTQKQSNPDKENDIHCEADDDESGEFAVSFAKPVVV